MKAFGLPMDNRPKTTRHKICDLTIKVRNRFWYGSHAGFNCFINGEKIFVNCLTRDEAVQKAFNRYIIQLKELI